MNIFLKTRKSLDMSQTEFAKALGVGQPYISKIEVGDFDGSLRLVKRLALFAKKKGLELDFNKFIV